MIEVAAARCEPFGERRAGPGVRLPDCQVHQHVRIERRDDIDDPLAIAGVDEVKLAAPQPAPRWVDVDAEYRAHPGLGLEQ